MVANMPDHEPSFPDNLNPDKSSEAAMLVEELANQKLYAEAQRAFDILKGLETGAALELDAMIDMLLAGYAGRDNEFLDVSDSQINELAEEYYSSDPSEAPM